VSLLRKPFSKQELLSVVAAALGKGTRGDPERPVPA
jgi:FixJ family two-component response regulator